MKRTRSRFRAVRTPVILMRSLLICIPMEIDRVMDIVTTRLFMVERDDFIFRSNGGLPFRACITLGKISFTQKYLAPRIRCSTLFHAFIRIA